MPDFSQYAPMISAFMTGPNSQPGSEWRAAHPRIDQFLNSNPNWQPGQGFGGRPGGMLGGGPRPGFGDPPHTMAPGLGGIFQNPTAPKPMQGYDGSGINPGAGRPQMGQMGPGSGLAPGATPPAPRPMSAAMNPGSQVPQIGGRQRPMQLPKI